MLFIQGVSKMLQQASEVCFHQQNKEEVVQRENLMMHGFI
jgi:hypothetical protein